MKLFKISQPLDNVNYDSFRAAIVAAKSAEDARYMHPQGINIHWNDRTQMWQDGYFENHQWASPDRINARLIGEASPDISEGVILTDMHAG